MSEDEREVDVESDDVPDVGVEATAGTSVLMDGLADDDDGLGSSLDKRAHHNALERRRRDHIKDSFHGLRDCIPSLIGEKVSRAHILNKATEYIRQMQKSGAVREGEIGDLKTKTEVLEEQVRALEQAKAMGGGENAEELLQLIADQVQMRQKQQAALQQQQQKAALPVKSTGTQAQSAARLGKVIDVIREGGSSSTAESSGDISIAPKTASPDRKTAAAALVGDGSQLLPSSINLLASNLKNAQTLLSALQKNLPANANLPANVKNLAARVLASPIRATGTTTSVPRGIVTATQVPKGGLPSTLVSALQQPQSSSPLQQAQPKLPAASTSDSTNPAITSTATNNSTIKPSSALVSHLKPTTTSTGSVSAASAVTATVPVSVPAQRSAARQPADLVNPVSLPGSRQQASAAKPSVELSGVSLDSSSLSSSSISTHSELGPSLLSQTATLSTQLLEPNSLLQGTAGTSGIGTDTVSCDASLVSDTTTQLTPDLLAQVSSFLNLPSVASKLAECSQAESPSGARTSDIGQELQASGGVLKRGVLESDIDHLESVKRARLDL